MNEKNPCRFNLFVRLKANQVQRYPNNSLTWTHRGDKYNLDEKKQLADLIKMVIKHFSKYELLQITDANAGKKYSPDQIVLKINKNIVEINKLYKYSDYLTKVFLPEWLK
jgi:hypothetical protein